MQLNASTCYAMQILLYMARNRRVVSSSELSEKLHISQRYILQFTGKLRDGRLIHTRAGMNGGYTLGKEAAAISIFDVIMLMEGDMNIPDCLTPIPDCGAPCKSGNLFYALSHMRDYVDTFLKSISFQDLTDTNITGHLSEILGLVEMHIGDMIHDS